MIIVGLLVPSFPLNLMETKAFLFFKKRKEERSMMNNSRFMKLFLTLILALVVGLAACGSDEEENGVDDVGEDVTEQQENDDSGEEESEESSEGEFEAVTIVDKTDTEVTIEEKPERIISTVASSTEIVFAVGAGDRVVGVTEWDNYPEEVFDIEKIGDMNLNIEKIVELEPDLVVSDLLNAQDVDALRNAGLTVVVLGAQSLEEVYEDIELVGKATGEVETASEVINEMKETVDHVTETVSSLSEEEKKTAWLEIDPELFSAAQGSFLHELLTLAGGKNIIEEMEGWPQISEEIVIERDPDVIITTYGDYVEDPVNTVLSRESWSQITAVENEHVIDIDSDILSRAGPRLVDGLMELAKALYPDLF